MISSELENEFLKKCGLLNKKYILYFNINHTNDKIVSKEKNFIDLISNSGCNNMLLVKALSKNEKSKFSANVTNVKYNEINENIFIKNAYIIIFFGFNINILNKIETSYLYKRATIMYAENINMFNDFAIATDKIESIITFITTNWDKSNLLIKYVEEHHNELDHFVRSLQIKKKLDDSMPVQTPAQTPSQTPLQTPNDIQKNIKVNYKKGVDITNQKDFINILTYHYDIENNQRKADILECVKINLENPNVKQYYLFVEDGKEKNLNSIYLDNTKVTIVKCNKEKNFKELFSYSNNTLRDEIICILRPDIFLPNNDSLDILMSYLITEKRFYSLSRLEKRLDGVIWKVPELMESYYCDSQDAWLFKSPIDIKVDLDFDQKKSNIKLNKCILDAGYFPINDTDKFKVIGLNSISTPDVFRTNNNKPTTSVDADVYYLPETMGVISMSIDALINKVNLNTEQEYLLKCDIFNKLLQLKKK